MEGLKVKGFRCDQKLKAKSNWTFFHFRFMTTRITQHHYLPTVERWRKNTQSFHCSWWDIPWEGWYPYCLFLKPRWYFLHKIWNQDIFYIFQDIFAGLVLMGPLIHLDPKLAGCFMVDKTNRGTIPEKLSFPRKRWLQWLQKCCRAFPYLESMSNWWESILFIEVWKSNRWQVIQRSRS